MSPPSPNVSPVDFIPPKTGFLHSSQEGFVLEKKVLVQKLLEIKFSTKYTRKSLAYAYSLA